MILWQTTSASGGEVVYDKSCRRGASSLWNTKVLLCEDTKGKNLVQSCTQPDYRKSVGLVLQAVLVAKRQLNLSLPDVKAWRYIHCASQCDH